MGVFVWGPFSSVYFAVYEKLQKLTKNTDPATRRNSVSLGCGMLAGGVAGGLTQPLDCIRTRLQVKAQGTEGMGFWRILSSMVRAEGLVSLFRGTSARVLWLAPGCGVQLAMFEAIRTRMLC